MNAREQILADIRTALSGGSGPAGSAPAVSGPAPAPGTAAPSSPASGGPAFSSASRPVARRHTVDDLIALFAERVADYRATVTHSPTASLSDAVAAALPAGASVIVAADLTVAVPGALVDDGTSGAADLDRIDAVVTGARVAIAETGTLVLDHGPGQGRRAITLVPDRHICIVRADQIVADVPDALAQLAPSVRAGRPLTWISGPSATSDIELSRVEGVHGPRTLIVIIAT
ncbi:lactate utilization protein C [Frankia sp. R82]|uniref:LutC/YkgG family protein n=1 Tax=Frankia sp. R82 TaxID=2950553 RepID=UPI0035ABB3B6